MNAYPVYNNAFYFCAHIFSKCRVKKYMRREEDESFCIPQVEVILIHVIT